MSADDILRKILTDCPKLEDFGLDDSIYEVIPQAERREKEQIQEIKGRLEKALNKKINRVSGFIMSILCCHPIVSTMIFWGAILSLVYVTDRPLLSVGLAFGCIGFLLFWNFSLLPEITGVKKLELELQELERRLGKELAQIREQTRTKVAPFEEAVCNYYEKELTHFHSQNLFRKRSGSSKFEADRTRFEAMLDEAREAGKKMVVKSMWSVTADYQAYLSDREKRDRQASWDGADSEAKSLVETAPVEKKIVPVPPEKKHREPRQVDWEKVFQGRMATGLAGEEAVVMIEQEYLREIGRNDLADKVRHVSKEIGDGLGYDVLSFFEDGREKYVEVKTTTVSIEAPYYLTRNEYDFLKNHPQNSFIYRLLIDQDKTKVNLLWVESGVDAFVASDVVPISYEVKKKKPESETPDRFS